MKIVDNYKQLLDNVATKATSNGRLANNIEVLTVTKGQTIEDIKLLADIGVKSFGESKLQEAEKKIKKLSTDYKALSFHFIGNFQTNKTKKIVQYFDLIHSVDRLDVLKAIDKEAKSINKCQDILIQVNLAKEEQKGGVYVEDLDNLLDDLSNCNNVNLRGFMTMQPFEDSMNKTFNYFKNTRKLFDKYKMNYDNMDTLSMGMSHDYDIAIAEGATMLRIGSLIFNK